MRVTGSMMTHQMVYWMNKQLEQLNEASNIVASGKQIGKPSDDPTAYRQIQEDSATLSRYDQYEYSLTMAGTWINASDATLSSVYSLLEEAQSVVASAAELDADEADANEADANAQVVRNLYLQVLNLANSLYGSGYMYSGNLSDTQPFADEVAIAGGVAADVVFDLAEDATDIPIEITDADGNVVRTLTASSGTAGTNTVTWDGLDDDGNTLPDGDYCFTVSATDALGDAVASYAAYRGDAGGLSFIYGDNATLTLTNNGGQIFSPALQALSQIAAALENAQTTDSSVETWSEALDEAMSRIKSEETSLANADVLISNASDRLDQLTVQAQNRISDLETGSTEEAAAKLTAQETAYEVTVNATAKILAMAKLSDYI